MRSTIIKFILPILFALALALGFFQRSEIENILRPKPTLTYFKTPSADSLNGYYAKSQDIIRGNTDKKTVSFLAVGDIMLSRNVAGTIAKANDPLLPFSKMAEILKTTDFNFANLESPISGSNDFSPTGSLVFNAPEKFTTGLTTYNFQILNLANNHALDQGQKGLFHTLDFLDTLHIKHTGVGKNMTDAWKMAMIETNEIKICFVGASYSSVNDGGKAKNDFVARISDISNLGSSILNLKSTCDFIVATMHAGTEYTSIPNKAQEDFAHASIDAGADMVIGAHPHWVQTIENYKGKYIFYSLGNFIFDQEWSAETKEGLTLKISLSAPKSQNNLQGSKKSATINSIELIPVIIENYSTPRPATAEETKKILKKIGQEKTILP